MSKGQEGPKGIKGSRECLPFSPLRPLLDSWCSLGASFSGAPIFLFPRRSAGIKGWEGPKGVEGSGGSKGC